MRGCSVGYLEAGVGVSIYPALVCVVVVVGQPGPGFVPGAAHYKIKYFYVKTTLTFFSRNILMKI